MQIGSKNFDLNNQVLIMGILNVTPDSFSDGGKFNNLDASLKQVEKMIADGADLIDLGGESTRPGHTQISDAQEIDRVVPMIAAIHQRFDIPISIDTYKGAVGAAALKAGADLVNDIWGFKYDPTLAEVTAAYQVPCILMHNRDNQNYQNLMADIKADLQASIDIALKAGISRDAIILDPGIGFAKDYAQNMETMHHLETLQTLGYPILLGTSRKGFIGLTLNLPVTQRVEGTVATTVIGVMKGASIIRVHDVLENKRAAQMAAGIMKGAPWTNSI
ncbi:MAG: dihydropteroate synthase [Acetobacterium sp.]|jgi:dihydropteroate synthase|uniref:dihydropteroate synthase n=1 Tax=Acetobacterium TaxID=33951 RepID=UPI000DBEAEAB|nr:MULTISPECIES: dihydropteroate synthase [unclassified Acetobacterium]AWW28102.1 dihydropteroate synthase [Acetobacterium sp. KB-1]MDK2941195.1 dihydropteroate synthase [Acetobacterium sp.]MDZ5726046.1 dihydropteroate synthase [Acetobacterium sp. K1/6]